MEIVPLYTDCTRHAMLGAVLRWCDTSQGALYRSVQSAEAREELLNLWEKSAVNRSMLVEMLVSGAEWEHTINAKSATRVIISPVVSRVGRTSWGVRYNIRTAEGTQLANASTVMVSVDAETATKPVPVPRAEVLRQLLQEGPALKEPCVCSRPPVAILTQTEIRFTDCDVIGHMNNAVYGDIMHHAVNSAVQAGLGSEDASNGLHMVFIEYIGQVKALETVDVYVWWDGQARGFGVEIFGRDGIAARGTLVPREGMHTSKL